MNLHKKTTGYFMDEWEDKLYEFVGYSNKAYHVTEVFDDILIIIPESVEMEIIPISDEEAEEYKRCFISSCEVVETDNFIERMKYK